MKISYDPTVDALTIRLVEDEVECEMIQLNDRVSIDLGPGDQVVSLEVLDASDLVPGLRQKGVSVENISISSVSE